MTFSYIRVCRLVLSYTHLNFFNLSRADGFPTIFIAMSCIVVEPHNIKYPILVVYDKLHYIHDGKQSLMRHAELSKTIQLIFDSFFIIRWIKPRLMFTDGIFL